MKQLLVVSRIINQYLSRNMIQKKDLFKRNGLAHCQLWASK